MLPSSREIGSITPSNFDQTSQDDFIEQMLSHLSPWTDLSGNQNPKPIWDQNPNASNNQKLFSLSLISDDPSHCNQNQITQPVLIQRSSPLTLGNHNSSDRSHEDAKGGNSIQDNMHNSLSGSVIRSIPSNYQQHFQSSQPGSIPPQNFGGAATTSNTAPVKQKVRARRGQATDPHSIAERLRRERIAERMKALQELLPNASKTDKATMLDEIIDYVKFLQLQVKVLSMSRLGGAAAVVPLVTDISSSEGVGGVDCIQSRNGAQIASDDGLTVTEEQVAKLMEEDMGSAMQYLQGKGLCLMPISLASAISTAAGHHRHPNGDAPSSPSVSVLTVQSALGPTCETDVTRPSMKDAISVSNP